MSTLNLCGMFHMQRSQYQIRSDKIRKKGDPTHAYRPRHVRLAGINGPDHVVAERYLIDCQLSCNCKDFRVSCTDGSVVSLFSSITFQNNA